jgi:hypothetical protein
MTRRPPVPCVMVCLFSGSFVTPTGGPGLDGQTQRQHDVLTLLVSADGEITFESAGYDGRIAHKTPAEWRRLTR